MDEQPSELERLAREVTERRDQEAAKAPEPAPSGGHAAAATRRTLTTSERWQTLGGLLTFAVIGYLVYRGCTWFVSGVEQAAIPLEATSFAKKLVKRSMSFPEEAKVGWERSHLGEDGVWTIRGEVVGKNAFGVRIRKKWTCQLKRGEGEPSRYNWEALALEFYDP